MTTDFPPVLANREIVVVDVEGNGQNPAEIIEIALLSVDQEVGDLRSWLIRPQRPILPMVTKKVHGISNADVAGCPPWTAVAPDIARLLDGRVLVAHGASVERRVLGTHLPDWSPSLILDTIRLAKHVRPGLPSYGLNKLTANLDVTGQRHRAAFDTWCAWKLVCALVEEGDLDWAGLTAAAALPGSDADTGQGGLW